MLIVEAVEAPQVLRCVVFVGAEMPGGAVSGVADATRVMARRQVKHPAVARMAAPFGRGLTHPGNATPPAPEQTMHKMGK